MAHGFRFNEINLKHNLFNKWINILSAFFRKWLTFFPALVAQYFSGEWLTFFLTIAFQPSLREKEIIALSSLDFIEKKENVIFLGPPGVGKTHLSVALGIKACMAKYRVAFITAQKLLEELMLSARDGSLADKLLGYSRLNLLVIDELGYMPVSKEQANLLFRLVSMRYEKGSIILTSNYNFNEWGEIFSDQVVAAAIIDRLVHHARIYYINGTSYRLKGKLKAANNR